MFIRPMLALAAALSASLPVHAAEVPYPAGYRAWTHVKSMAILPGHALYEGFGGLHHIYANAKALAGYQSGRFKDGSVIVFDLLEADTSGNALSEGKRKIVGVMHRDAKRYAATGGWGFEGFAAGDPKVRAVGNQAKTACFDCHAPQAARGYVFSSWRE
ncbi:MAG: cytochrome P460 family protein [Thiobacillus sp.]|nr:cytochrome P460 family protein [Thiobacillus sp.]